MTRRSVVTRAPRRAVVLRAGPPSSPAGRGERIILVAGVLLLLFAGWLAVALPEEEVVTPQYRASFPDMDPVEYPSQLVDIEPGREAPVTFEVSQPNTYAVQITVFVQDDQPTTLPDTFEVFLESANGTVHEGGVITTERPRFNATAQTFDSPPVEATFLFSVLPRPADRVFEAAAPNETLDEAIARVSPQYVIDNRGEWTLRVLLRDAGHCPEASADPSVALQSTLCLREHPDGQDPGNSLYVILVRATAYRPDFTALA